MTTVPVVWLEARVLCWDQAMIDAALTGRLWPTRFTFTHHDAVPAGASGAVVVCPARYWAHRADELNDMLAPLEWVLLVLSSDEESTFPIGKVRHGNIAMIVQTPNRNGGWTPIGEGWPSHTDEYLAGVHPVDRDVRWFFAGQITHERRRAFADASAAVVGGVYRPTSAFADGMPRPDYMRLMAQAKFVPCPGGPATPSSFRLFEALEAGAVPIADDISGRGCPPGYWHRIFPDAPFPVISDWSGFGDLLDRLEPEWPALAARTHAWWQRWKVSFVRGIEYAVAMLSGVKMPNVKVAAVVTSSPTPSDPDLSIVSETVGSIRRLLGPDTPIHFVCDGIRDELRVLPGRAAAYDEYVRRAVWACDHLWNAMPLVLDEHFHQALATQRVLADVNADIILFVEHDTPIVGDVDVDAIVNVIAAGDVDVVRLYHEAQVPDEHRYLMNGIRSWESLNLMMTNQWSQRPHFARTSTYRDLLLEHFTARSRTMIEDKMHSVAQSDPHRYRIGIYVPDGDDWKRSTHLDGRAGDPKFDMRF